MAEVLSFMDVKRQKDFELEKNLLKELSLRQIIQSVKDCLEPLFPFLHDERDIITEGCIDFAIEASLFVRRAFWDIRLLRRINAEYQCPLCKRRRRAAYGVF